MNLIELPPVMLIQIFEYLSYEEVSKKRLACRKIDQICQHILNCGFNKVVRQHAISFKQIKALLPRRESERRTHCLARHADILTSIETRISMLSMTYTKYMDLSLCCFIPGRVLDEIIRILRLISKTNKPLRPHEVLQELRDISSMAIEHFDEKIAHTLKKSFADNSSKICSSIEVSRMSSNTGSSLSGYTALSSSSSGSSSSSVWNPASGSLSPTSTVMNSRCCESIRQRVNALLSLGQSGLLDNIKKPTGDHSTETSEQHKCPEARATMMYFKKLELEYKKGIVKMHRMQQIQTHQSRRLQQALSSVSELNVQVIELKKRLEDVDAKNREISANIKQINIGDTASTSNVSATPVDASLSTVQGSSGMTPKSAFSNDKNGAVFNKNDDDNDLLKKSVKRRYEESNAATVNSCDHASENQSALIVVKKPKT